MRRRRGHRRSVAGVAGSLALVISVVGCSGDDTASTTTVDLAPAECAVRPPQLRVDLIDDAIEMVEAELGGPQSYFEINATELVVNLFVALDGATEVQPFVLLAGELSSRDPEPAEGNTFVADALAIDPQRVTSCVTDELPTSTATAFEIIAGPAGAVSYSLVVDSANGGQLVVAVRGDGTILAVDPV